MRISLPTEYHAPEKLRVIVAAVAAATGIPADETYVSAVGQKGPGRVESGPF